MTIQLDNVSKRFRYEWIFKNLTSTLQAGQGYAITGPNGSGKSTLMKILSGHLTPSKGSIVFGHAAQTIEPEQVYRSVSYAAPYIELIEEFTLAEALAFHQQFKPFQPNIQLADMPELLLFTKNNLAKPIKFFSSGMKQRLKLGLAILSDSPILLLDEPNTNLDQTGLQWYEQLITQYHQDRLVVVASNMPSDYFFCQNTLNIMDFK